MTGSRSVRNDPSLSSAKTPFEAPSLHELVLAILSPEQGDKVGVLERFAARATLDELVEAALALDAFANDPSSNVYQRVRAVLQAHAVEHLITFNASDFAAFPSLSLVAPRSLVSTPEE